MKPKRWVALHTFRFLDPLEISTSCSRVSSGTSHLLDYIARHRGGLLASDFLPLFFRGFFFRPCNDQLRGFDDVDSFDAAASGGIGSPSSPLRERFVEIVEGEITRLSPSY